MGESANAATVAVPPAKKKGKDRSSHIEDKCKTHSHLASLGDAGVPATQVSGDTFHSHLMRKTSMHHKNTE